MAEKYGINVYSEIGQLKTVLLHRPGDELANLSPDLLERLLFDDTPDLAVAQKEHDAFAKVFKDLGVEVLYIRLCDTIFIKNNIIIKYNLWGHKNMNNNKFNTLLMIENG
ncbi:arginine deiminase family protein [Spiroplasma poulsonii]|nr:arginine deiminase family protein [Spiroplasma poulsonii]UNF61513.1 arginine deiminase family protein [Spiroplasma poulsonii]